MESALLFVNSQLDSREILPKLDHLKMVKGSGTFIQSRGRRLITDVEKYLDAQLGAVQEWVLLRAIEGVPTKQH